jgi:tRNA A-37 threonylcarbamoyl transferase component Bud32
MEFLEGETPAQGLNKGALALPDPLKIGIDILDSLAQAHRAGIVHRDLKPGNMMLTKAGAKLLDVLSYFQDGVGGPIEVVDPCQVACNLIGMGQRMVGQQKGRR